MAGMNTGLDAGNPALVAAFRSAMAHQLGIVAGILCVLLLGYLATRRWLAAASGAEHAVPAEAKARRILRLGFGVLWVLDGILQAQPRMAGGLTSGVIGPAASASPRWVQDVVSSGSTIWSYHPVQAAAAAVWIQAGIGLWLLVAGSGSWSRLAGLAGLAWGLIVWVFGEAFGGIFAPGLSWLTGAPGAVLLYVVAGALIALPPAAWASPRLGRLLLAGSGAFWLGMALLQSWPGRGYWGSGTLTGMVQSMAEVSQPHAQAAMVSAFGRFTAAYPAAVNATAVAMLAGCGLALIFGGPRLLRAAVPAAALFCFADWVLVQDFGVPGGLGTDPNSMPPWVLLVAAGYLAATDPLASAERGSAPPAVARPEATWTRRTVTAARQAVGSGGVRSVAGIGAVAVILTGAGPMAAASVNRNADPIIAQALSGTSVEISRPAPGFDLVSQSGRPVTLASLRGKVLLLTFLDPVCGSCSVIADDMRAAGQLLGADDQRVELVAIAADSLHADPLFIGAFDKNTGMTAVRNWLFLTGAQARLQQAWNDYEKLAPGMMVGMNPHSDVAFVIDASGYVREVVKDDPGPGTSSIRSSFAVLLSQVVRRTLG